MGGLGAKKDFFESCCFLWGVIEISIFRGDKRNFWELKKLGGKVNFFPLGKVVKFFQDGGGGGKKNCWMGAKDIFFCGGA